MAGWLFIYLLSYEFKMYFRHLHQGYFAEWPGLSNPADPNWKVEREAVGIDRQTYLSIAWSSTITFDNWTSLFMNTWENSNRVFLVNTCWMSYWSITFSFYIKQVKYRICFRIIIYNHVWIYFVFCFRYYYILHFLLHNEVIPVLFDFLNLYII